MRVRCVRRRIIPRRLWRGAIGAMLSILMVGCWSGRKFVRCPDGCVRAKGKNESQDAYLARYQRFNTVHHFKRLPREDPIAKWMTNRLQRTIAAAKRVRLKLPKVNEHATIDVIQEDEPLAFTERGGRIYISTGMLLGRVRSCEEVTAIIAHELAHAIKRHPAKRFAPVKDATKVTERAMAHFAEDKRKKDAARRAKAAPPGAKASVTTAAPLKKTGNATEDMFNSAAEVGASPALVGATMGIVTLLFSMDQPYSSRVDEESADHAALRILRCAGLPGRPLADVFNRSAADAGECPDPFYSAHPDLRDRAARIASRTSASQRGKACVGKDEPDFNEIQRQLKFESHRWVKGEE